MNPQALVRRGDFAAAERALAELPAGSLSASDVTRVRALIAAGRGDGLRAERLFVEIERDHHLWPPGEEVAFLCEAALSLDTLGLTGPARVRAERARARAGSSVPAMARTEALLDARAGDADRACTTIDGLLQAGDVPAEFRWRLSLLGAWATLRAGNRRDAGVRAAVALERAVAWGGPGVAAAIEPDITRALAPLANEAGAPAEHCRVGAPGQLVVRLFGPLELSCADGRRLSPPSGQSSALIALLALHRHPLPLEVVLETFYPDTAPDTSRHRLRQLLVRLRGALGEVVVREEAMLGLAPAWVDVREFARLALRARASRGTGGLILTEAALALAGRGRLLAGLEVLPGMSEICADVDADLTHLRRSVQR